MIEGLKPYPKYKDSGVEWLGQVPEGWEVRSLGSLTTAIGERGRPDLPLLSVVREKGVVLRSTMTDEENHNFVPDDLSNYKVVRKGDLVINKMKAWQGSLGIAPTAGVVSPAYYVFDFRIANRHYGQALLRSRPYVALFARESDGVRTGQWDLATHGMKRIPVLIPSVPEQESIVRFLSLLDRRIRHYIRAKQKLISVLNEQRRTLIFRAMTRGLGPDVSLMRSDVDWLGGVPEHWDEVLMGRCLRRIDQGWSPVAAEGELEEDQWVVLTLSAVKRGSFNASAIKPIPKDAEIPGGIQVQNGDLLLTRSNTRELVGDVCIVENVRPKAVISDLIYRLVVDEAVVEPRFLMYQLLSPLGRRQIEQDARGSSGTMPKISQKHIRSWRVVRPHLEEQRSIVLELDRQLKGLDAVMDCTQREITLLREYRTRLIADVVTGKLDVRAAAAALPADPAESDGTEPLEDEEPETEEPEPEEA